MQGTVRWAIIMALVLSLIFVPVGAAFAQELETSRENMIIDTLVLRPLGFVATVTGSVIYVISYPFSAAGGNTDQVLQKLVKDPAEYTFNRPLGDI